MHIELSKFVPISEKKLSFSVRYEQIIFKKQNKKLLFAKFYAYNVIKNKREVNSKKVEIE